MKWKSFLMGVPVLLALLATTAVAQGGYGGRMYDPKSEVTVKGTVQDLFSSKLGRTVGAAPT